VFSKRNRTPPEHIAHGLYLYYLVLSTRSVAKALSFLHIVRRSPCCSWKWIQKYLHQRISSRRKRVAEFIVDEAAIKAGSEYMWLWVAIEPKDRRILAPTTSKERNMFVAERFIEGLVKVHGKHPVSTDGGTWYPQAHKFLKLRHHIHSPFEKSVIERTMQHIKDRTECFDDYFPCNRKRGCNFLHVKKWLGLFATMHNREILNA
jgi:putative transposase